MSGVLLYRVSTDNVLCIFLEEDGEGGGGGKTEEG